MFNPDLSNSDHRLKAPNDDSDANSSHLSVHQYDASSQLDTEVRRMASKKDSDTSFGQTSGIKVLGDSDSDTSFRIIGN